MSVQLPANLLVNFRQYPKQVNRLNLSVLPINPIPIALIPVVMTNRKNVKR